MGEKKPRFLKRLAVFLFSLIGFFILIAAAALGAAVYFNSPPEDPRIKGVFNETEGVRISEEGDIYFEVKKGESAQSAGIRLERAGLIKSRYFWQLLCRYDREFIKSGTYQLEIPASQMAIHKILVSGKQLLTRVTIPEGVTLSKAAAILEEAGICPSSDFLEAAEDAETTGRYRIPNQTMEGYLFPDTYLFPAGYPADRVIAAMADNFYKKIEEISPSALALPPEILNQKVIVASIVEREYRIPEEAPLMAGVFYNRLDIGMALQSCATVEYIITEIEGRPHPEVLYNRDIEIRNPYNTYMVPGLPPGPISMPGAVALSASFFPQESNYLYFRLTDADSGKHYFSRTFDEHIQAGSLIPKGRP
jgi:UPF0755 protein